MFLNELKAGERAVVRSVGGEGALRQHFLDMGVIPGAEITLVKFAPMGDPIEFRIHEYELTLRVDDAKQIGIEKLPKWESDQHPVVKIPHEPTDHPGLGEGGRYHVREGEHPLPDDQLLTFALAGNQNCGKTTLFNQLTGSNQHVGNFPGVTVDQKSGSIRGHENTKITDLPGIYSMSPYTDEEIVSREFILREQPTGIINIVDATNIERNLYLTLQLIELDRPMVLALNMMDELTGNGGSVDINAMESLLGIPIVPISAAKGEGIEELVAHALHVAHYQEKPGRMDFCDAESHRGAVHRCLHGIMHLIEDHAKEARIPVRFAATKIVEGDSRVIEALMLDQNEMEMIEHIICQMEKERGLDRSAAIADMRFSFIGKLVDRTFHKAHESRQHERSRRIDKVLTGKYTAIPAFIAIMSLVFYLTFNVIGAGLQDLLAAGIGLLQDQVDAAMTAVGVNEAMHSLVIDGIFQGVGTVLSFLPIIVTLFFFLSLLEDTGYMARIAFVMDKWLRKIGLSGRSIVRLLGAGHHVDAHAAVGARPPHDDPSDAVHELLGQAADLRLLHRGVLRRLRCSADDCALLRRDARRYRRGLSRQEHHLQGRGRAVCHGAAELPHAGPPQCHAAALGEVEGLPRARVLGHLHRDDRHLVFADVQLPPRHGDGFVGEHARCCRGHHRADLCAAGLRRLAHLDGADLGLHG